MSTTGNHPGLFKPDIDNVGLKYVLFITIGIAALAFLCLCCKLWESHSFRALFKPPVKPEEVSTISDEILKHDDIILIPPPDTPPPPYHLFENSDNGRRASDPSIQSYDPENDPLENAYQKDSIQIPLLGDNKHSTIQIDSI